MAILLVFHILYISDILIMPHNYDVGMCYDPARLCPGGIGLSFLERSGLVQIVRDPRSAHLFVRPTFHAVYATCVKAWHT